MTIRALENAPGYKDNGNVRKTMVSIREGVKALGLDFKYDENPNDLFMSDMTRLVVVFPSEQKVSGGIVRRKFTKVANVYLFLNKAQLPEKGSEVFDSSKIVELAILFIKHDLDVEYI